MGPRRRFWRPKWRRIILHEDFGGSTAERARPIAKLEYDEYSLEYGTVPYAGHPEGCGGFIETPVGGPPPPPDLRATTPTIVSGVFERVAFLECPGASLQN